MRKHELERKAYREELKARQPNAREAVGPLKTYLEKNLAAFQKSHRVASLDLDGFVGG